MSRRGAWTLIALCAWTLWIWLTFTWIIGHQDHPAAFKIVHGLIAAGSIAFGVAAGRIGYRALRSGSDPAAPPGSAARAELGDREALRSR